MNTEPRFHRSARAELRKAVGWYEDRQEGLGLRFFDRVDAVVNRVARGELPGLTVALPTGARDIRKARVPRFPYRIYFERQGDEYVFLAVAHLKRRPGYWLKRRAEDVEASSGAA